MQNEQDHTSQHLSNRAMTAEAIRSFHYDDMERDFLRAAIRLERNSDLLDDPANFHLFFSSTPLLRRNDELAMAEALQKHLRRRAKNMRMMSSAAEGPSAAPAPKPKAAADTAQPAAKPADPAPIELTETGKSVAEKLTETGRKIGAIKAKAKRRSETARAAANARWAAERKYVRKSVRKPAAKKIAAKKTARRGRR